MMSHLDPLGRSQALLEVVQRPHDAGGQVAVDVHRNLVLQAHQLTQALHGSLKVLLRERLSSSRLKGIGFAISFSA